MQLFKSELASGKALAFYLAMTSISSHILHLFFKLTELEYCMICPTFCSPCTWTVDCSQVATVVGSIGPLSQDKPYWAAPALE